MRAMKLSQISMMIRKTLMNLKMMTLNSPRKIKKITAQSRMEQIAAKKA